MKYKRGFTLLIIMVILLVNLQIVLAGTIEEEITVDPMTDRTNINFNHTCKDNLGLNRMGFSLYKEEKLILKEDFNLSREKEVSKSYPFEFDGENEGNYTIKFYCEDSVGNKGLNQSEFYVKRTNVSVDYKIMILLDNLGNKEITEIIRYHNLGDYSIWNPVLPPAQLPSFCDFEQSDSKIYNINWVELYPKKKIEFCDTERITLNSTLYPKSSDGIILWGKYKRKNFNFLGTKTFEIGIKREFFSNSRIINSVSYIIKIPKNHILLGALDFKEINPEPDMIVDEGRYISVHFKNPDFIKDTSGKIEWFNLKIVYNYSYWNWLWVIIGFIALQLFYEFVIKNILNLKIYKHYKPLWVMKKLNIYLWILIIIGIIMFFVLDLNIWLKILLAIFLIVLVVIRSAINKRDYAKTNFLTKRNRRRN